jgi:hypothetical protein
MTMGFVLALLAAGCGDKKDAATEAKVTANEVKDKAGSLLDKAGEKAGDLKTKAQDMKSQAAATIMDAAGVASRVKDEIQKVYKTAGDYDVQISAEPFPTDGMKDHEAKLAAMPNVKLGDLTVGYEEMGEKSLNGTTFQRHFRATWVQHGMKIGISYYTKEEIDLPAFGQLVLKLVPIVQAQLGMAG